MPVIPGWKIHWIISQYQYNKGSIYDSEPFGRLNIICSET